MLSSLVVDSLSDTNPGSSTGASSKLSEVNGLYGVCVREGVEMFTKIEYGMLKFILLE